MVSSAIEDAIFCQVAYIRLYNCQQLSLSGQASNVGLQQILVVVGGGSDGRSANLHFRLKLFVPLACSSRALLRE
jgi:hypothetical protein